MRKLFVILLTASLLSCGDEELVIAEMNCQTPATMVDMSGLDGCGYMIRLENDDLLYPIWQWGFCGTPPLPEGMLEDPLYNFEFRDGLQVRIDYTLPAEEYGNICMAGTPVIITCIEEINAESDPF